MRPCASISCKIGDDKTRARKEEFPAMKTLPYEKAKIEEIAKTHPTPFHIYDEAGIRRTARALLRASPSAAHTIGKQLFSPPFPQLKGRKNKKLPQLVKIFLDTQLPP